MIIGDVCRGPWRDVAGDPVQAGKLPKKANQAIGITFHREIKLGVGAFQIRLRHHRGPAMTGTGDKQPVQVVQIDQANEVHVDQVQPRRGPPVTQQPRFQVRQGERLLQQRLASILDAATQDVSLRFGAECRQVMRNGLGVRVGQ